MTFIEALRESSKGKIVVSCVGILYTKKDLNPKRLSDTAYICNAITMEKERRGQWRIFNR